MCINVMGSARYSTAYRSVGTARTQEMGPAPMNVQGLCCLSSFVSAAWVCRCNLVSLVVTVCADKLMLKQGNRTAMLWVTPKRPALLCL